MIESGSASSLLAPSALLGGSHPPLGSGPGILAAHGPFHHGLWRQHSAPIPVLQLGCWLNKVNVLSSIHLPN